MIKQLIKGGKIRDLHDNSVGRTRMIDKSDRRANRFTSATGNVK